MATGAAGVPAASWPLHVAPGMVGALGCAFTHVVICTSLMTTTGRLHAATDKGAVAPRRFVAPVQRAKARALALALGAMPATMLAVWSGAGADPSVHPLLPGVRLGLAGVAVGASVLGAIGQYGLIARQGRLLDQAARRWQRAGRRVADQPVVAMEAS